MLHALMTALSPPAVIPIEGWHVLHLFYKVEHGQWSMLSPEERIVAKTNLTEIIQEIRAAPDTQLLVFSMVSPKADIGFMLLTPDLHLANIFEKRLTLSLGPDVLTPMYSFLSLTEESEYATADEAGAAGREAKSKSRKETLYPMLPTWEVFCFYPMSRRRTPGQNWYALPLEQRKQLMADHARIGQAYQGKILQIVTGCTGLDDSEWGVTLFAHDSYDIKAIIHQMRFDEVGAQYTDFGEFFIGLTVPLDELFRRLQL